MCGIAGRINFNGEPVSPVMLKRMTDAISHRGPDGEGQWIEGNVGIGHRRLAIIDLSPAGHQPMISSDHRYILSYNGEIYNYRELRTELEADGTWFRSNTDSEMVLYALAQWGTNALLRFNGMFAIALWDRKEKRLLLARDRYGIKPLYYTSQGSLFAFGSEQRAITSQPSFKRELNKSALVEYFTFQNIFTDQTLLQGIHIVPAGHYLTIGNRDNETPRLTQYWDYSFNESTRQIPRTEYIEELDRLFKQAVTRQLVSDVEVGSYLSGGIDSGSITAIAAQNINDLKTFTCGFDLSSASGLELGFDERSKAEAMSALFKTEHYEMVLKAGDMERSLPLVTNHIEEPRVGQSYPNYYAAKLSSRFVKVVLSGSGGDELFGGYPWRYYRAADAQSFEDYISHYYSYWQRLASERDLEAMFAPIANDAKHVCAHEIFAGVFTNHANDLKRPEDYINHSLYFEAKTFLHGLLTIEDKLSMAHGLESRVPFMDNDLVDFAMQCPVELKINNLRSSARINENDTGIKKDNYFQKTGDGKRILREAVSRYIPCEVAERKKQGFSSPDASWFRGESIDFVKRRLLNSQAAIYSVLDYKSVVPLVEQHLQGKKNNRLLIWSLLSVDTWMMEF